VGHLRDGNVGGGGRCGPLMRLQVTKPSRGGVWNFARRIFVPMNSARLCWPPPRFFSADLANLREPSGVATSAADWLHFDVGRPLRANISFGLPVLQAYP
jgi:hypothetical protein